MIKLKDFLKKNENVEVQLDAMESRDVCDSRRHVFWRGMLHDIPAEYLDLVVIDEGWMIGAACNGISVFAPELACGYLFSGRSAK